MRSLRFVPRPYSSRREFIVSAYGRWIGVVYETHGGWVISGEPNRKFPTKYAAGEKLLAVRGSDQRKAAHRV